MTATLDRPLRAHFVRRWIRAYPVGFMGWQLHCPEAGLLHGLYMGKTVAEARTGLLEVNGRRIVLGLPTIDATRFD
jgi:hypothetical protein